MAVKRPMMIDAIAKMKAAAKVKAISFSIRFPLGTEATLSVSLSSDFPPHNEVISQCKKRGG